MKIMKTKTVRMFQTQRAKCLAGLAIAGLFSQIAVRAAQVDFFFPAFVATDKATATLNYTHPNTIIGPDIKQKGDLKVRLFFDVWKTQPGVVVGDQTSCASKLQFVRRDFCDQDVSPGEAVSLSLSAVQGNFVKGDLIRPGVIVSGLNGDAATAPPSLEMVNGDGSYAILIGLLLPAVQKGAAPGQK